MTVCVYVLARAYADTYICVFKLGFLGGSVVKNPPVMQGMQETRVQSLCWEDPLEEEVATHSSILAWTGPWAEEPSVYLNENDLAPQFTTRSSQTCLDWENGAVFFGSKSFLPTAKIAGCLLQTVTGQGVSTVPALDRWGGRQVLDLRAEEQECQQEYGGIKKEGGA